MRGVRSNLVTRFFCLFSLLKKKRGSVLNQALTRYSYGFGLLMLTSSSSAVISRRANLRAVHQPFSSDRLLVHLRAGVTFQRVNFDLREILDCML